VDPALLAFLSKAKSAHYQADIAEEDGDASAAIEHLDHLVKGPRPKADSPEVREVVADTLARMAEIRSGDGQLDEAMQDVQEGLRLATETTHYRGRLMEVEGVVHQRRHKRELEAGNARAAEEAKIAAIASFEKAIEIQDEVIKRALEPRRPDGSRSRPDGSSAPTER
jgi:hypothetical protein